MLVNFTLNIYVEINSDQINPIIHAITINIISNYSFDIRILN